VTSPESKKRIVIAVDATEPSRDPLLLGRLLASTAHAPAHLCSVLPDHAFADPGGERLQFMRRDADSSLRELAASVELDVAEVEVIPGNLPARELQAVTERDTTGVIVVGSTRRGPVGRISVGGVGHRLLMVLPRGTKLELAWASRQRPMVAAIACRSSRSWASARARASARSPATGTTTSR
jgi:nucleotide-binding universal stress UspA family protein